MNNDIKYDIVVVDYPTLLFKPKVSKEITEIGRLYIKTLLRFEKLNELLYGE